MKESAYESSVLGNYSLTSGPNNKKRTKIKESEFQAKLIYELRQMFPGCVILKNDANYIQGFPDLLILYGDKWAALECKREKDAHVQPNQKWWVNIKLKSMSFASFIYPENKEEVLNVLQQTFGVGG